MNLHEELLDIALGLPEAMAEPILEAVLRGEIESALALTQSAMDTLLAEMAEMNDESAA